MALYRDRGAWEEEATRALPALLEWCGLSWRWVDAAFVRGGGLRDKKGKPLFRLFLVPGGWAVSYKRALGGMRGGGPGDDQLRAFLAAGGGYLGFCAGAFAACDKVSWAGRTYEYYWDLFPGTGEGPLPWNPLSGGRLTATHGKCRLDLTRPALKGQKLPSPARLLLYGGPRFRLARPSSPPAGWEVLARHGEDGSPAVVSFLYPGRGGGRVVLCSFHPAVLTSDGGLYDRFPGDLSGAGAGRDPDGPLPDWRLARALVFRAAGLPPPGPSDLPDCKGKIFLPGTASLGKSTPILLGEAGSAGRTYLLLASTGVSPGIPLRPGLVLPLCWSDLLPLSTAAPAVFSAFLGRLDSRGKASAFLHPPANPLLGGLALEFAFLLLDPRAPAGLFSVSGPAGTILAP